MRLATKVADAGDLRVVELRGNAGDHFDTEYTEDVTWQQMPTFAVYLSGRFRLSRPWQPEFERIQYPGETNEIQDFVYQAGVMRREALDDGACYVCVSSRDNSFHPSHERVTVAAGDTYTLPQGSLAVFLDPIPEDHVAVYAETGPHQITGPCVFERVWA